MITKSSRLQPKKYIRSKSEHVFACLLIFVKIVNFWCCVAEPARRVTFAGKNTYILRILSRAVFASFAWYISMYLTNTQISLLSDVELCSVHKIVLHAELSVWRGHAYHPIRPRLWKFLAHTISFHIAFVSLFFFQLKILFSIYFDQFHQEKRRNVNHAWKFGAVSPWSLSMINYLWCSLSGNMAC